MAGATNGIGTNYQYNTITGEMPDALANSGISQIDPSAPASNGMVITVDGDTGEVYFDPPAPAVRRNRSEDNFNRNLAEGLNDGSLFGISTDYLDGVAQDIMSRSEFIANYNKGIDLLGLKIEEPSRSRGPRTAISRVKHPALLDACVAYQSTARAELLPAAGPAKIMTIGASDGQEDDLARDFEADFNYYLTDVAKEYYPDTDRALFHQGFAGSVFKKVYRCPVRRRPVSDAVYLDQFIVSNDASDLASAIRKTNELLMSNADVKRQQFYGGWLDIDLGTPVQNLSPAQRKTMESQGIAAATTRTQDLLHTIYEGYWCIDPADYGIHEPNAPAGLPLPYRVAIDKDSQKVLGLWRNWKKGDEEFKERQVFVKYGLVPGLGFYDYGYLHLIGNQTRALTALMQLMIDQGMLANFPGGFKIKGVRSSTNELNPGLGEWVDIDIGGLKNIKDALMGMPYKDISPNMMQLWQALEQNVKETAGTVSIEVGDGRSNVPVGTIMAMIEQQTKTMGAIHKRNHTAQKEELSLLRDLFVENPKDLWRLARDPRRQWEVGAEFADLNLVPASDPNVPSQTHRIMLNMFLMQAAQAAPMLFGSKAVKIADRVLHGIGINDAEDLLPTQQEYEQNMAAAAQAAQKGKGGGQQNNSAVQRAQMELPLKAAQVQNERTKLQLQAQETQRQAANEMAQHAQQAQKQKNDTAISAAKLQTERERLALEHAKVRHEAGMDVADTVLEHARHVDEMSRTPAPWDDVTPNPDGQANGGAAKPRLQRPKRPT